MRTESRRIVSRYNENKVIVEDNDLGIFLFENNFELIKKIGLNEFQVLDFSKDGNILLLNSKEWLTRRNANKTWVTAIDIRSNITLFRTDKFLGYRSIIDSTSSKCLLEYYNGLCSLDLKTGEAIFRHDKLDKTLYNADIHYKSNIVFMPTGKKSLLTFDFKTNKLEDIKLERSSATAWVKFNNSQTNILVSDKKNALHCFEVNSYEKPIWKIDFSKYKLDTRIWSSSILVTNSNLGCIHATRPCPNGVGFCAGSLYIFDTTNGKVLDNMEYSHINLKLICDFNSDEIILDDLTKLSLSTKEIRNTISLL